MPYAFYLDASACSGCKACQVACQDKHALPAGVRWRRVYEVSGGGWQSQGSAWQQDAFAYNLSVACNHCTDPICVEVCPTGAMHRRPDGVVLVAEDRCLGCRYCAWACPYGAPQYHARAGVMTKCTLCADELELDVPPACVAACGLRALDFGAAEVLAMRYAFERTGARSGFVKAGVLAAVSPPLPDPDLTRPALLLRSHPHAARATAAGARIANREEVSAAAPPRVPEPSLIAFTLLTQLAVGLLWVWVALRWIYLDAAARTAGLPLLAVGPLAALGMLASLLHLGRWLRAWRALANLRGSWLSREILLGLAFLGGWLVVLVLELDQRVPTPARAALATVVGAIGLGLLYAMARVYRLRTMPAWDSARTFGSFLLTALLLGGLAGGLLVALAQARFGLARLLAALFVLAAGAAAWLRARFYRHAHAGM